MAPVLTEKSYRQQELANKYVFKVHNDANKNDVDVAIQYLYKVNPVKINIVNTAFKEREKKAGEESFQEGYCDSWKRSKD